MGKEKVCLLSPQLLRVICISCHIAEHYYLAAWNRPFVAWQEWQFLCSATLWGISAQFFASIHVQYSPLVQVMKPHILLVQVAGRIVVEKRLLTTSPWTEVCLNGQYLIPYVVFLSWSMISSVLFRPICWFNFRWLLAFLLWSSHVVDDSSTTASSEVQRQW